MARAGSGQTVPIAVSVAHRSLWESADLTPYPALDGDVEVDVAVVGGGITGAATACRLKEAGKRVALVEMRRIGAGTTGRTTAKVTLGHGLVYAKLRSSHGPEAARAYAESNRDAIARMQALADELGIDCGWETASNYVYTESSGRLGDLEEEVDAIRGAGIAAELTQETELPFAVAGAIRVDEQAQFHPLEYIAGLVSRIPGDGSHVFEETRATGLQSGRAYAVETGSGRVLARDVVLATQLPFLDRGLFFAKAHPQKSFAVSAELDEDRVPRGMYVNVDEPTRSIRSAPAADGRRHLIVGGESGRLGDVDERPYGALAEFMEEHYGASPELRWSAHDYMPVDGLPYIGRLRRGEPHLHVATGFAKWGLTKATIAAEIIADAILGRPNPWAETYDATRLSPRASAVSLATENAYVARRFVGDRLRPRPGRDAVERLAPGEAAVVRIGAQHYAVCREESGETHVLSARCPHLGCLVAWSEPDRKWECPCHGSRFAPDGSLLQGPATTGLAPRDPDAD